MKTLLLTTALLSLIALAFGCGSAPANNTVANKPVNIVVTTPVTPASTPANTTTSNASNATTKTANVTKGTRNPMAADETDAAPAKTANKKAP